NATDVVINVEEPGENKIESTIEGKKIGDTWEFLYSNNDLFKKDIWVEAYFSNKEVVKSDKKTITNQEQSYENAFENILPISSNLKSIKLTKQAVNLNILGWKDDQNLLITDKNNLLSYNIYDNKKKVI